MGVGRWMLLFCILILQSCKESKPSIIDELFEKAQSEDYVDFIRDNPSEFLYFKSGFFLDESSKNALLISSKDFKIYKIQHYILNKNNWKLINQIDSLEAFPSQFEITYNDYNFDEQTDIFIQVSASQGYSLSRGHLLIVNPKTKKFSLHEEARNLGNMKPDSDQKVVFSELSHGYNLNNNREISILTNKWVDGKLKTIDQEKIIMKE